MGEGSGKFTLSDIMMFMVSTPNPYRLRYGVWS